MSTFSFLVETYRTERLKTLGVWLQVPDERMGFRPEPRARTPLEHMVHQCVSEDTWMRNMLGIAASRPALPAHETRAAFIEHYGACSAERLEILGRQPGRLARRRRHILRCPALARVGADAAAHAFRASPRAVDRLPAALGTGAHLSTYGPTADTGGLFQNGARVILSLWPAGRRARGWHREASGVGHATGDRKAGPEVGRTFRRTR